MPLPLRELAVVGAGLAAVLVPMLVWLRRPSLLGAARIADRRLGLADRLSTAMESCARSDPPRGLVRLQIADAATAAQGIVPRRAAPIAFPREGWVALALAGALILWAQFLQGWTIPELPAARTAAVIHREGRTLVMIAQHLEGMSRTRGLPETRRLAPRLQDLGRRLETPRVTRQSALRSLQEAVRELRSAQARVERRLGGAALQGGPGSQGASIAPALPAAQGRLEQAIRELESFAARLGSESGAGAREDLARRLRAMSESLDQMKAPASSRRDVAAARREVERGHFGAAASALGDALADLQSLERMLGDDQALGEARHQVESSAERIAQGGSLGVGVTVATQTAPESGPAPSAPGPNPVIPTAEETASPPPGPNEGSLPGEGRGPHLGAPTPRLEGSRVEEHLAGRQGEGTAVTRDLLAPGRAGAPHLSASPVPADVAHQNDRALAREPLPPAYLTLIRRYFEALETGR
ncbi:MAG: hypothetical protein E6H04_05095 [Bacillati bacterium ANGP1]|uniref:Uncharacterized protein n=1 Tax=Candidatus Segetimicrobium genomatis TaxID=2569760 RepID=A0A537JFZ0_9BACT|nr:MAG: hypothetical protein E6H04_05095 [Terrabacteria group bacterium ANGP1]